MQDKRQKHVMNTAAFDDLLRRRKAACNTALENQLRAAQAQQQDGPASPPRKIRPAREDDAWLVSRTVAIEFEPIHAEESQYGPLTTSMLWGIHTQDLWVEMEPQALEYLRAYLHTFAPDPNVQIRARKKRKTAKEGENAAEAEPSAQSAPSVPAHME